MNIYLNLYNKYICRLEYASLSLISIYFYVTISEHRIYIYLNKCVQVVQPG